MRLKLLKVWGDGLPGDEMPDVGAGVAEQLIRRGVAEEIKDEPAKETASCAYDRWPERDKTIRPAKVKRKGGANG